MQPLLNAINYADAWAHVSLCVNKNETDTPSD